MSKRVKVVKLCNDVKLNSILIELIDYIYSRGADVPLSIIDDIIYDDKIIEQIKHLDLVFSAGHGADIINKFICKLDIGGNKNIVKWLFRERIVDLLGQGEKTTRYTLDFQFINLIKEIVWVYYYTLLKHKRRLIVVGNENDILMRLQGVFADTTIPSKQFEVNKIEYLINIISLKNATYQFLPYPASIDPRDLIHLLRDNNKLTEELGWIIVGLCDAEYNPYERYHIFKFLRNLIWEVLSTNFQHNEGVRYVIAENN